MLVREFPGYVECTECWCGRVQQLEVVRLDVLMAESQMQVCYSMHHWR